MSARRGLCISVLFLLLWHETGCYSAERNRRAVVRLAVEQLEAAPAKQVESFTTFQKEMSKVIGVSEKDLASKEIQDWYNKEITAKGKKINYEDPSQTSRIKVLVLSMLCELCLKNNTCLYCEQTYGCSPC